MINTSCGGYMLKTTVARVPDTQNSLEQIPGQDVPFCNQKLRILGMRRKSLKNASLPGSLDMLMLKSLTRGNLHGYAIGQAIQQSSSREILIEEGSLYPALQRLELNGWIDGEWGLTPSNRRARIYRLTPRGRSNWRTKRSATGSSRWRSR